MTSTSDEIVMNLGRLILTAARASAPDWDYAGYTFVTATGRDSEMEKFIYKDRQRGRMNDREVWREVEQNFLRLRQVTHVDGDEYWKAIQMVLRREGGDLRFLFEFDNPARWKIGPANATRAFEVLVGEVFPEAL